MDFSRFKRILLTLADSESDIDFSTKGQVIVQVHGDLIEASADVRNGNVVVVDNGVSMSGEEWLLERIAHLSLLAERIISYTPAEQYFVTPSAQVLDDIEQSPDETRRETGDAVAETLRLLDRRPAGATKVLYLTSDAGEGKTTIINEMARRQAMAYRDKKTSWLLLPVSLMGRTFLRFDDVIVGALMNKYRFPMLYYNSLVELARLGAVVLALDGFEEVFVESEGEALSAVGSLMSSLQSEGALLIATRKAFYEFKNFSSQIKLFDSISGTYNVNFSHLSLDRWTRAQFISYASILGFADPIALYDSISKKLGEGHAFLTRAYLVKSLLAYLSKEESLSEALENMTPQSNLMLFKFIDSMIEREVAKWLDKSGEPFQPLLTSEEHHELLSIIADEMWSQNVAALSSSMLEGMAEIFCESKSLSPSKTRQVRERIKQHALLVPSSSGTDRYSFDHEEFKNFFLGQAIGSYLKDGAATSLKSTLRRTALPGQTLNTIVTYLKRHAVDVRKAIDFVIDTAKNEFSSSYLKENAGAVVLELLDGFTSYPVELTDLLFPEDSLVRNKLKNVTFCDCVFQSTDIGNDTLEDVHFIRCKFATITLDDVSFAGSVTMEECEVQCLIIPSRGYTIYSPIDIKLELHSMGIVVGKQALVDNEKTRRVPDIEMQLIEKVLRAFTRSTALNEDVLRKKSGQRAVQFIDEILPELEGVGMFEEVSYSGSGSQRRYRLKVKMKTIADAISNSGGSFKEFLKLVSLNPDNLSR